MIAWAPVVLWALGLFLLSEIQAAPPALQPLLAIPDKIVHFALYLALGGLLARARWVSGTGARHELFLLVGWVYAAVDEWHQGFVPGRSPELGDWLADAVGVASGYFIVLLTRGGKHRETDELRQG